MKKESSMKKLFGYAENYKYLTIASWILSAISSLIALVPFVYIWKLIDEVIRVAPDYAKAENLTRNGWLAVGFSILSMLIYIGGLICSHIAAFHVQASIRSTAMHHIVTLPMGFMDDMGSGKLRKTVNECSAATETYLAHQLPDRAGAIATPIGLLALLLMFDWKLGLLSLIPVVLAFIIMARMTGSSMKKKMEEYQNSLEEMSNEAVEYVRGIPVVKTFGQSIFSFKHFKQSIDNYKKWVLAYTKELRTPMLFYTTIINATFAVLIAAGLVVSSHGMTNEFLLNLILYIIVTPIITVTLNKIMYSSENAMIVEDALKRIDGVMNMKPFSEPVKKEHVKNNGVQLQDVSFAYKGAKANALNHISLEIKPGEHVALVGPSGGGKTTLASMISRFYDVTKGNVLIGGVNVKNIGKKELMNQVSFVFQDSRLLKTSILENIRMARKNATREEVMQVIKDAQCEDIIAKLPQGIDTVIGTNGVYLSGGEEQRISIARVMLKNAPILILDEATAFADPDNETKVQAAFSKMSEGKTVIMIAHRLSTVVGMDRIYVIKNGTVEEMGSHEELIAKGAMYAQMWKKYQDAARWKVSSLQNKERKVNIDDAYREIEA